MIDLREKNNPNYQNRLLSSNIWNVTYDEEGKTFWFFTAYF